MKRRMTFFYRYENSAARRANLSAGGQRAFNSRAIIGRIDYFCGKENGIVRRGGTQQFDGVFRCNCAGCLFLPGALHQVVCGGPVAMAIEQRADDSAIQNARKRFVFRFRFPFRDNSITARETADVQTIGVGRSAAPTSISWSILFLQRRFVFHFHGWKRADNCWSGGLTGFDLGGHRPPPQLSAVGRHAGVGAHFGSNVK